MVVDPALDRPEQGRLAVKAAPDDEGHASRDPQAERIARLERENARLKRDIEEAKIIIDIQKKTSQLLGIKLTDVSDHEKILYGEPNE